MKRLNLLFIFGSAVLISACATDPKLESAINACSRENNAYSAMQRIGNTGYRDCLYKRMNWVDAVEQAPSPYTQQLQRNCSTAFGQQDYNDCVDGRSPEKSRDKVRLRCRRVGGELVCEEN